MNQKEKNECVFFRLLFNLFCFNFNLQLLIKLWRIVDSSNVGYIILIASATEKFFSWNWAANITFPRILAIFLLLNSTKILWAILIVKSQQLKNHITSTLIIHFTVYFKLTSSWILINWSVQIREETKKRKNQRRQIKRWWDKKRCEFRFN